LGCCAYTSPSRWNSPATLIGVGVAFAISVVVAGHWWSDKPKLDLDSLGKQVTSGLQNEFDTAEMKCKRGQHLATDGLRLYVNAVEATFAGDIDHAMLQKIYTSPLGPGNERTYSPPPHGIPRGLTTHSQLSQNRLGQQCRIRQLPEFNQPHPVRIAAPAVSCHPLCHPCLADTTNTGQRDQPGLGQGALGIGEFAAPADKARHLRRQVAATVNYPGALRHGLRVRGPSPPRSGVALGQSCAQTAAATITSSDVFSAAPMSGVIA
jgi:hypothetical protein